MNFFSNPSKLNTARIVLLLAFVALLIYHLLQLDPENSRTWLALVPPICFIAVLGIQIRKYYAQRSAANSSTRDKNGSV